MKKSIVFFSLVVLFSLVMTSNIMATPFLNVKGFVNPFAGDVIKHMEEDITTFTEVKYSFNVIGASPGSGMHYVQLKFEDDVFANLDDFTNSGGISYLSHGWNANDYTDGGIFHQRVSALDNGMSNGIANITGTLVGAGEELTFSMQNVEVYNKALTDPSCPGISCMWNEGQVWSQGWNAAGDPVSFGPYPFDPFNGNSIIFSKSDAGGSTSPTPEPGTFLLLGSGLAGVIVYVRKKKCLMNI